MMTATQWCPSCTCGWHKPVDAFDVTPPEPECRNTECQCHREFWRSVDLRALPELEKRRLYGDR